MKQSGLLLLAHVVPVPGQPGGAAENCELSGWAGAARSCQQRQRELMDLVEQNGMKAFPTAIVAASVFSGVLSLVSGGAGLGSLAPNIVCLGHPSGRHGRSESPPSTRYHRSHHVKDEHSDRGGIGGGLWGASEYVSVMQSCLFFGKSVLIARGFGGHHGPSVRPEDHRTGGSAVLGSEWQVDVWAWAEGDEEDERAARNIGGGRWSSSSTLSLTLQLAHLYAAEARRDAELWQVRLLTYVETAAEVESAEEYLRATLRQAMPCKTLRSQVGR